MKKGRLVIGILLALVLISTLFISGCVPKKSSSSSSSDDSPSTPSSTDKRIASLESAISNLQSRVSDIDSNTNKNYDDEIASLQNSLNNVKNEVQSSVDSKLSSFQPVLPDVPRYALVTDIGSRSVDVTVYGTGDFPVIVILYGEDLDAGQVEAEENDYDVEAEFLYGQEIRTSLSTYQVTIPGDTYMSGDAIGDPPPNAHTHEVTIPDAEVSLPGLEQDNVGTMLVIIVEPDDPWTNGYQFELDTRDAGDIYYATAAAGYAD